jgi:8-oxo-dGTP pyrophosphatase MutT (NUDIX family)
MAEQTESRIVYPGAFIQVREQFEPQPLGGTQRFEIVEHKDAVAMVAVRRGAHDQLEVALVRQRRPAVDRDLWEIPAGLVDGSTSADPLATAKRELREEIGYAADDWHFLTRELPSPGFSTEAISIYLAMGVHPAPGATPDASADPTEIAAVRWLPLAEALADRTIDDGKTILGLHLADELLDRMTLKGAAMAADGDKTLSAVVAPARDTSPLRDTTIRAESILLEEYNYASSTAYQAMEDRARLFNLYLVVFGIFVSGLTALYQIGQSQTNANNQANDQTAKLFTYSQPIALALLVIVSLTGFVFFFQLIKLRQAYRDSLLTMNVIKEYYLMRLTPQMPDITTAFRWRLQTIPAGERRTVTFLVCTTIAALASLALAAASFVAYGIWFAGSGGFLPLLEDVRPYAVAIGVFLIAIFFHNAVYRRMLNKERDITAFAAEVNRLGLPDSLIEEYRANAYKRKKRK